jgi:hypothetical protein
MRRNRVPDSLAARALWMAFFTVGITVTSGNRGCCLFATSTPATYKFLGKSRDVRALDELCAHRA